MVNTFSVAINCNLPNHSKVWIYQSSRAFSAAEAEQIEHLVTQFTISWASHGSDLMSEGFLLYNRFVVLVVNEASMGASGCSIDKSVAFVKYLEQTYQVDFFDRFQFAYLDNEEIKVVTKDDFATLFAENKIASDTLVFDNLVQTLGDLKANWIKPLNQSWHRRFI